MSEPIQPVLDVTGKKLPADLVNDLLRALEHAFYPDQRDVFFRDRQDLIRCLTYPASHLEKRGARLSAERYQAIVLENIILPMKRHMQEEPRYFPRYFKMVVQSHMAKHWEDYYEEAKSTRLEARRVLGQLQPARDSAERDRTVEILAEMHRTLALKSGRKKAAAKASAGAIQSELF